MTGSMTGMRLEEMGIIGNCQVSALVERTGAVVWCCLPRFDSEPVFGALLDEKEGGRFQVAPAGGGAGVQRYLPNTNVLETLFETPEGKFRVLDLAPRFLLHGRSFRPTQLVRILDPLAGAPRVRVTCEPVLGWFRKPPRRLQGSNHLDFEGFQSPLRLTADVPPTYLEGQPFPLTRRQHLVLSWGPPVEEPLAPLCERYLSETVAYWTTWVKQCNIPYAYQNEVIRSALALKLHCFEDTGAIIAASTTSIPEAPGSGRTWDYRYCWLRDAFYAISAFRFLGQFEERERFIHYLLNIAASSPGLDLQPLYRLDGGRDIEERVLPEWPGFGGEGPVRVGNAAAGHRQNDIFGELVMALSPVFLDDRFREEQCRETLELLERLTHKAIASAGTPDAGIWEYRRAWKPQTFSSLMSWAATSRMATVAERHAPESAEGFRVAAAGIQKEIIERTWNAEAGSFVSEYGGKDLDASLLQMASLRFLPREDPRLVSTVETVQRNLVRDGWLMRYRVDDGLGKPKLPFVLCTFWLVEALAALGRTTAARAVLGRALAASSRLGLLSEDYDPTAARMWGNFPQAYSHVGLIRAAFAASPRWEEIL